MNLRQSGGDLDALRTMPHTGLAVTALVNTVTICHEFTIPLLTALEDIEHLVVVIDLEYARNIHAEGTIHTIAAARTWNQRLGMNGRHDILYGLLFSFIQRLNILEGG